MAAGSKIPTISIRPALYERLRTLAVRRGKRVEGVSDELLTELLVERSGDAAGQTFAQILAPVHQYSREAGYTDEEIGDLVDAEVKAYRADRRTGKQ